MITETLFIILLVTMLVFLVITLHYQNEAFGAFTIILCLILGAMLIPGMSGVAMQTGANISTAGDETTVTNTYSSFTDWTASTLFFIIVLYLSLQIVNFRKNKKIEQEDEI